jgi:hypothetical protein
LPAHHPVRNHERVTNEPGWYPDPFGVYLARWWDGTAWTVRVALRVEEAIDPHPGLTPIPPPDATARVGPPMGRVTGPAPHRGPAPGAVPTVPARTPPAPPANVRPHLPAGSPAGAVEPPGHLPGSVPPPPPGGPRPVHVGVARTWWRATVRQVSADLAVHGLAYIGVLLLFAGVFGFVAFAFGEVDRTLRPLAELVIAASFFGVAAFLNRRGAPFVAAALGLLGGAVLPLLVIASVSDRADIPPDPDGAALVVSLASATALLAAVYLAVARRRPSSPLRFVAAPTAWLTGAAIGLAFVDPIPSGEELTTPHAPQWALAALAVAVTVLAARRGTGAVARATLLVATPGLVLTYLLTIAASARDGWPVLWLAIAGIAALVTLDLLRGVLPAEAIGAAQPLVVAASGATLVDGWGWGWAGACAVVAVVVIGERSAAAVRPVARSVPGDWGDPGPATPARAVAAAPVVAEPDASVVALRLVVLAGAAAAAVAAPWPSLVAAGLVWAVGLLRLDRPRPWLPGRAAAVAVAVAPVAAASASLRLLDPGPGLVVVAAGVLTIAIGVRATHRTGRALWRWWVPAAAVATVLAACTVAAGWGALAAAVGALAILVAPGPVPARLWAAAAAWSVAGMLAATSLDLSRDDRSIVLAGVGVALVTVAATVRRPLVGHVGCIGHIAGSGAIALAFAGRTDPVVRAAGAIAVAAFAVGSILTAVARELGGSRVVDLLVRCTGQPASGAARSLPRTAADVAPLLVAVPAVAAAVGAVTSRLGTFDWYDPWCAMAAGAAMSAMAVAGRPLRRHDGTAGRIVNRLAFGLLAIVALPVAAPGATAGAVTAVLVIVAVAASGRALRTPSMHAAAWAASLVGTLDAAHALGVERSALHHVALAWGILALLGALAVDELVAGRAAPGELARRASLRPALVLGPVAIAGGLAISYGAVPDIAADEPHVWGGWSLAVAAAAALIALRRRVADPTFVTWTLLVVAWAGLVPDDPLRPPWPYVAPAGVMAAVAYMVRGRGTPVAPGGWIAGGHWDVPPLGAGAATLAFALYTSAVEGWVPATYLSGGFVVATVGVAFGWAPLVPVGAALAVTGALAAGHGAAALAFAIVSVLSTALAARRTGVVRSILQWCGSLAAAAAWFELVLWRLWPVERAGAATALASGGVLLVLSLVVRFARTGRKWVLAWALPAGVGLGAAAVLVLGPGGREPSAETALAGGLVAASLACVLAAAPLRVAILRDLAGALVVSAAVVLGDASAIDATAAVLVALAGAMAATTFVVSATVARRAQAWVRPALTVGLGATGVALVVAAAHLPERALLTAALAATGLEAAALGLSGRRRAYLLASPAILCASWITFASGSLTGDPQWFTVPVGLTVLVVVGIARADLRRTDQRVDAPVIVALDLTGMAFVVGAALGRTVTESIAFGLVAVAFGVAIAIWAVLTRVRRRLAFGVGTVTLAVALMLVGPLVEIVPEIHGATLWLVIAAFGVAAITIAAFLERGRAAVRSAVAGVRTLTEDWE